MNVLLDTHTFLWFWWDDAQLSDVAKDAIVEPTNRKLISTASCWEIAIKVSLRKLDLGEPYRGFIPREMQRNNFEMLSIDHEHMELVAEVPFHHRDPFDRMLVAQSLAEDIPIISRDSQFDAYGVTRIW